MPQRDKPTTSSADSSSAKEKVYDEQIAPLLKQAGDIAQLHDMSLSAVVEYAPGHIGRTEVIAAVTDIAFKLPAWAARAKGNADALIFQMVKHATEHGHNSICIAKLMKESA